MGESKAHQKDQREFLFVLNGREEGVSHTVEIEREDNLDILSASSFEPEMVDVLQKRVIARLER